jgi:hypothetical protein
MKSNFPDARLVLETFSSGQAVVIKKTHADYLEGFSVHLRRKSRFNVGRCQWASNELTRVRLSRVGQVTRIGMRCARKRADTSYSARKRVFELTGRALDAAIDMSPDLSLRGDHDRSRVTRSTMLERFARTDLTQVSESEIARQWMRNVVRNRRKSLITRNSREFTGM